MKEDEKPEKVAPVPSKPARKPANNKSKAQHWIFEEKDSQHYGPLPKDQAEALVKKLGKAKIFEAPDFASASEQFRKFLSKVAKGQEFWD